MGIVTLTWGGRRDGEDHCNKPVICVLGARFLGDRPEIRGIMTIGIGSVRYAPGWGLTDGMEVVFGWDGA